VIRNKLYYGIKPLVPAFIRHGTRRWFALGKRRKVDNVWPILPGSERPPDGWPGWPRGKKFAFVLTHDVEGPDGVAKCRQLMELEMKWGFRSSFNFIPEADYRVTRELREELARNGFEVGVHDLRHDGKLYRSREDFGKNAAQINRYLKAWGAAGFRSGFMFHNLEWLHDLEIQYDASTFDTDPFEPQPDGVGTIFPFWKESTNGRGYVELPYTLPQDSTLFLLFGERDPEIWLKKLDWVAAHGGMALVNVHPDYIQFPGEPASRHTFPVEIYERLLQHARQRTNECWHCLAKEMAAFAAPLKLRPPPRPRRICMVTYSYYLADARVTRYAEALADRGDHVDVLSLQRWQEKPDRETSRKVNIVRLQPRIAKTEKSPLSYLWPTLRFLASSSIWIARSHFRQPYDVFHIHNMPDFLVFAAAYPRLKGAKVILDIHDIVPEFYGSKFGVKNGSPAVSLLKWTERLSARKADHIIMSNHLWLDKYAARTGTAGRCSVFINNVDRSIFHPRPKTRNDGKFIIIFPGGLQWHQGLDIALRAFHKISGQMPEAEFHIYGDGNMKQSLMDLSRELGLEGKVHFFNPIPVREIAGVMANADLGVVPKRADSFGNEAYSTKIMEFMSLGVPVVVSSTKIDRYHFNDSVVRFFESGNPDSLAAAMQEVIGHQKLRQEMVAQASEYAASRSWESRKGDYLNLVDSLCRSNGRNRS
jgi:glycosyltransferase involved in cell wall biosynthesis/peptidoglycan/xylan/chitin deacetylase (PgdA/CDA1 family)